MTVDALVVADESGVIRLWNSVAVDLFGYEAERAVGSSLDLIVPQPYRERHWSGYRRAWEEGIRDAQRIAVMPVLCADGEVRPFAGHLLPIKGPHGALAAIAGVYSRPSELDKGLYAIP